MTKLSREKVLEYNAQLAELVGYEKMKLYVRKNTGNINDKQYESKYIYTTDVKKIQTYKIAKLEYPVLDIVKTDLNNFMIEDMWNPNQDWNDLMLCFEQAAIMGYGFSVQPNGVCILDNPSEAAVIIASSEEDVSVTQNGYNCVIEFLNHLKKQA